MLFNIFFKMNNVRPESGFRSYIDESELESITLNEAQRTRFLDGEMLVCEAPKVLLYSTLSDRKKATLGVLTVTTFKLSFATVGDRDLEHCHQQNFLLGNNDICLSSIATIYQIGERTKKKLIPGQNVTGKVKELLIICKNMKSLELNFKEADKESGKNIVNALLHHAYPKRHSLLFAYDYKEPYILPPTFAKEVSLFREKRDWIKELQRSKCENWRISEININYQASPLLYQHLIVPQSATDSIINLAVEHFRNRCFPVWIWGTEKGAALVRMADLLPTITDRTQENMLLEHIRKSHPELKQPHIIYLNSPTPKEIQSSFQKLRDLCVPENTRAFKNQDFKFYGLLDNTKWLTQVSICLTKAQEAATQMHEHVSTVVLQEANGQDLNCVVSSLTQIILDPLSRTKSGFQSLIQKHWVAMGHPFAHRLGHIISKEVELSPIFLLFLDCVWQLLQQYPQAFQISETYLTTLWDSAHISIFDTFLFNCEHQRFMAENNNSGTKITPRSVWDWREQFSERDIALFCNPLYCDGFKEVLKPNTGLSGLDIWSQCYFRWLPDLEIRNGGKPQIDLFNRLVVSEILQLQQRISNGEINGRYNQNREDQLEMLGKVNSFFPFSYNSGNLSENIPINNVLLTGDTIDSQSILNLTND